VKYDYYLIDTKALNGGAGVGGGVGKRKTPERRITTYFGVKSVEEYSASVEKLDGKTIQPKTGVPGWGYLTICMDIENNLFGLLGDDANAK